MPRASMIVKDILATSWGVHAAPRPSHAATFTHSYQRICSAFMLPCSRRTYAAAFTQHLSCRAHTALTLPHSRRSILSPLSRRPICAAALTPPHFCRRIHAAACTEPHLCSRSHAHACMPQHWLCSTHAARPPHSFAELTPPHWCRRSHAAALVPPLWKLPHLCSTSHATVFVGRSTSPRISRCSILPSHLRWSSSIAAFTLQLSWGRSAGGSGPLGAHFPTQSTTPAGGSRRGRARGGAGGSGEKGVLGWGWGGAFYMRTYPRKGCVTAE